MAYRLTNDRGFSIVELMIAMLLGLFVSSVVIAIFVSTNRSFAQDQEIARMQENARYAMRVLANDLSMVGFWGRVLDLSKLNATVRDCDADGSGNECVPPFFAGSALALTTDCKPGSLTPAPSVWAYNVTPPVEVVTESTAANAETTFGCISEDDFQAGTDILVVKRAEGEALASTRADSNQDGQVFLRVWGQDAMLLNYDHTDTAATGTDIFDWSYVVRIYYVQNHFAAAGDGIPSLFRKTLSGPAGAAAMQTEDGGVAPGIEYFHVMFGIDDKDNIDGVADFFTSSPTAADMQFAVSARIFVLVRSERADPAYTNDKVYQLGDVTKDYSDSPDNFYRRVFMTTVRLRNQANQLVLESTVL